MKSLKLENIKFFDNQKGLAPIAIILIIAGVLALAGGVYYLYQKANLKGAPNTKSSTDVRDYASAWQTYRNEKYGFEVKYPPIFREFKWPQRGNISFTLGTDDFEVYREDPLVGMTKRGVTLGLYIILNRSYTVNSDCVIVTGIGSIFETGTECTQTIFYDLPAKLFTLRDNSGATRRKDIYFLRGNDEYHFALDLTKADGNWQKYEILFDQILSTFKFIEPQNTMNK